MIEYSLRGMTVRDIKPTMVLDFRAKLRPNSIQKEIRSHSLVGRGQVFRRCLPTSPYEHEYAFDGCCSLAKLMLNSTEHGLLDVRMGT
jgi:hypothetical protein